MWNGTRMILGSAAMVVAWSPALGRAEPESDIGFRGWGPRVGLSINPDQVHFGAHLDFGMLAHRVRFQPNVELGFGDNVDLFTLNAEAAYRFVENWDVWSPYLGGGLGANIRRYDSNRFPDNHDNSDTQLGVNFLAGIEKGLSDGDRFFIEAKLSLNDVPDLKATVGWTFYH